MVMMMVGRVCATFLMLMLVEHHVNAVDSNLALPPSTNNQHTIQSIPTNNFDGIRIFLPMYPDAKSQEYSREALKKTGAIKSTTVTLNCNCGFIEGAHLNECKSMVDQWKAAGAKVYGYVSSCGNAYSPTPHCLKLPQETCLQGTADSKAMEVWVQKWKGLGVSGIFVDDTPGEPPENRLVSSYIDMISMNQLEVAINPGAVTDSTILNHHGLTLTASFERPCSDFNQLKVKARDSGIGKHAAICYAANSLEISNYLNTAKKLGFTYIGVWPSKDWEETPNKDFIYSFGKAIQEFDQSNRRAFLQHSNHSNPKNALTTVSEKKVASHRLKSRLETSDNILMPRVGNLY